MSISKINIKNYKSLKDIRLNLDNNKYDIYCLLGANGSGKSNIIDAISYFYENLSKDNFFNESKIDKINLYAQFMQIEIVYDLSIFKNKSTNEYIDEIVKNLHKYSRNDKILIRMTQYKDGSIEWFPKDKNLRKYIKKLYPLYLIDTRFINLEDWSKIWDIISELSVTKIKLEEYNIDQKLDTVFKEIYGEKYEKVLNRVNSVFNNERIKVNRLDYNNRFKNSILTRLGGQDFINDGNKLGYYSDGINSLKYIKLTIGLISMLSDTGWKNPIILLDEPEIGLHPQYIYEFVYSIKEACNKGINIIMSTHSSQIVTKLTQSEINACLYRTSRVRYYTSLDKMKDIVSSEDKFIISNKESECYFANVIVCVEGRTEIQILMNPRINKLFEKIKYATFYQSNSDNLGIKLIDPDNIKISIPYLNIKDMDKILVYKNKKFEAKREKQNPLYNDDIINKQKYMYYSEDKYNKYNINNYLTKTMQNVCFEITENKSYIENQLFETIIRDTKKYCLIYNTYPVRTTIEGCIVNEDNTQIILQWLKNNKLNDYIYKQLNNLIDNRNAKQKAAILRLCLNGKFDTFEKPKRLHKSLGNDTINTVYGLNKKDYELIFKIRSTVGSKTEGWIGEFLEYYFNNNIDILDTQIEKKKIFKKHFKELYEILQIISNMVKL